MPRWLIACLLAASAVPAAAASFQEALKAHFDAIARRDLPALERTITRSPRLDLFLPDGAHLVTRQQYIDLHKAWFAESNWMMRFDPVTTVTGTDLSSATVRTTYTERDGAKARTSESWLTLTFRKEDGQWRLVHDQNTRISARP